MEHLNIAQRSHDAEAALKRAERRYRHTWNKLFAGSAILIVAIAAVIWVAAAA